MIGPGRRVEVGGGEIMRDSHDCVTQGCTAVPVPGIGIWGGGRFEEEEDSFGLRHIEVSMLAANSVFLDSVFVYLPSVNHRAKLTAEVDISPAIQSPYSELPL